MYLPPTARHQVQVPLPRRESPERQGASLPCTCTILHCPPKSISAPGHNLAEPPFFPFSLFAVHSHHLRRSLFLVAHHLPIALSSHAAHPSKGVAALHETTALDLPTPIAALLVVKAQD